MKLTGALTLYKYLVHKHKRTSAREYKGAVSANTCKLIESYDDPSRNDVSSLFDLVGHSRRYDTQLVGPFYILPLCV